MTPRLPEPRRLASVLVVALFLPDAVFAQQCSPASPAADVPTYKGQRVEVGSGTGTFGTGQFHCTGWPYGPRVAPPWNYHALSGGPFVTYPWGSPGYSTRLGHASSGLFVC